MPTKRGRSKWQRLPRFLRWFYPGLRVKRWVLLLLLGLVAVAFGAAFAVGLGAMVEVLDVVSQVVGPDLATQVSVLIGVALIAGGLCAVVLSLAQIVHSIAEPLRVRENRALVDVLLADRERAHGPSVVAIGGGTGLSNLLRGLKHYINDITAIAAVSDEGGSSGRLRREMDTLPPGDVRRCLVALADDETVMARLLQYRFEDVPSVNGHSLGNLFIAALASITGDFERAVKETSKVLAIRGRVLPATLDHVALCARLQDGSVVRGETQVSAQGRDIQQVFLDPEAPEALPEAVEAIRNADIVVIGPGSTYTSIVPNVLVPGVAEALRTCNAVRVFVCNVMTQPRETDLLVQASDQVRAVMDHAGGKIFDYVLINDAVPSSDVLSRYEAVGARIVRADAEEVGRLGLIPLCGDFISDDIYAWHDPDRLARAVLRLEPVAETVV
ncbi:MAG: YvcK family protein [Armatimonadetes bacterium]|nr:YvcK family protein [Armatimonadota bacterium]